MLTLYLCVALVVAGSLAYSMDDKFGPDDSTDQEILDDVVLVNPSEFQSQRGGHDTSRGNVAFSVLLDHNMVNSGKSQHLKFDKVLLNDGDGYDTLDGVFRAPKCGVYSFLFSVAADYKAFVKAYLIVQGNTVDGAIATANCRYCYKGFHAQGSNSALVHMHKDQKAWIELDRGSTTYDADDVVYNSFSGFLLYTRE